MPVQDKATAPVAIDRFFKISERGSTVAREVRGGFATFFAMAYIIVLNPIILGSAKDMHGHQLDSGQLVTATVLTAAFATLLMGVIGNVPIALAAGLGVNTVVALQLAPRMSWPDAMGMVVLAGFLVMLLVATGLRERVMNAVPTSLRKGIAIGIGLFIMLIGLVDSGFVSRIPDAAHTTVPLQLGSDGHLNGWPVLVFALGALLTLALIIRKVPGAILISIVTMTVVALVVEAVAKVPSWGLTTPKWPGSPVDTPDFGLVGDLSLFGGFGKVGFVTGVLFVFTVLLSTFFDAMGTILGIGDEAKLMDEKGGCPASTGCCSWTASPSRPAARPRPPPPPASWSPRRASAKGADRTGVRRDGHAVLPGAVPHTDRDDGPVPGGDARAAGGRLPDPRRIGQGHRLERLHRRRSRVPGDGDDAVHVLDHQRHRHRLHHLQPAAAGGGPGP